MRKFVLAAAILLSGCAALPAANPPAANSAAARASADDCRAEVARLNDQLAAEIAERQRVTRAAARREDTLRHQLDAMKAIERGILERDDRMQTETR
jgi:hypothetical protein